MVVIAVKVALAQERPPLKAIPPDRRTPKLVRLLTQCWENDPARRPAAAELVKELMLAQEQKVSDYDQYHGFELD
ncbi:hypothetical protein GPECTOR_13g689 [Gonium pectorale]|uniref:Serine-threonine/tyrosine-protein kinase catalytic domain-containing protein n=1 Tax=Gonium pectorale TaxID=33097 RepID=A0A150GNA2_GONPE|nr:hypothetical protein GPECTOR_13g689 [Gonium pectorale]|eukprot:KXZ51202.1 hypothetical protein GPECTOR_13g689 [Gonium pectorale]